MDFLFKMKIKSRNNRPKIAKSAKKHSFLEYYLFLRGIQLALDDYEQRSAITHEFFKKQQTIIIGEENGKTKDVKQRPNDGTRYYGQT